MNKKWLVYRLVPSRWKLEQGDLPGLLMTFDKGLRVQVHSAWYRRWLIAGCV